MALRERRAVARVIRFGLVLVAIVIGTTWALRKVPTPDHVRVEGAAPPMETLGAGDVRIFNEDSTVDVILAGDRVSAGLSPQKIAEVRAKIAQSAAKDTGGIGGTIAQAVKKTVSDKIGVRAVYPVADIRAMRWRDGRILVTWRDGKEGALLGRLQVDGDRDANRFARADAERLIAAVRARQR